jgi:hypothetical protein
MLTIEEFERLRKLEDEWVADTRNPNVPPDPEHAPRSGEQMSFFEAGAGIGTKLKVAQDGYDLFAHGWEIEPKYIEVAIGLGVSIEQADLLEGDPHYEEWDIVYIAQPFKDDDVERNWEHSVQDAMRPGAVLIASFCSVKPYHWECFYRAPWRGVWRKPGGP